MKDISRVEKLFEDYKKRMDRVKPTLSEKNEFATIEKALVTLSSDKWILDGNYRFIN